MSHAESAKVFTVTYFHCCAVAVYKHQGSMWRGHGHIHALIYEQTGGDITHFKLCAHVTEKRLCLSITLCLPQTVVMGFLFLRLTVIILLLNRREAMSETRSCGLLLEITQVVWVIGWLL